MLVSGNNLSYLPDKNSKDPSNRHFFFSNKNDFTKLGLNLTKIMASVDLYCFGYKKMKNLASLAENIWLSGGNLFYYDDVD